MKKASFTLAVAALLTTIACTSTSRPDLTGMSFSDDVLAGKVVWHDLITEDIDAAREFYGGMFGWTFEQSNGASGGDYVVARDGDIYVAGLLSVEPRADGVAISRWLPYLSVADVDDALERGIASGGTVVVGPRNVSFGRVAAVIDSEGAVIGLARSRFGDPDDRTTRAAPGRVVWNELLANNPEQAAGFYRAVAGLDPRVIDRRGGEYTLLANGGVDRAGILQKPAPEIVSTWLTHFGVRDPAQAAERAKALGGRVVLPVSANLRDGTMAVVTDPAGAVLVLHEVTL